MKNRYDKYLKEKDKGKKVPLYLSVAYEVTDFLYKYTNITPNNVSMFNILIAIAIFPLIIYEKFVIVAVLLMLYSILDMVDGSLARAKNMARVNTVWSVLGSWLDTSGHFILLTSFYGAIGYYMNTWLWSFISMAMIYSIDSMRNKFLKKGGKLKTVGERSAIHWLFFSLTKLNYILAVILLSTFVKEGIILYTIYLVLFTIAAYTNYTRRILLGHLNKK